MRWKHLGREHVADMHIFALTRHLMRNPRNGAERSIARIESRDWVNVIALTPARELLFVSQWRHGTDALTLEIPGGMIDAGEAPAQAAARELREETGFCGGAPELLGVVEPNPAIQNNRCHTFLIENCERDGEPCLDDGEDIEVSSRPLSDVSQLVSSGHIRHALVVCGFWWLAQKRPDLLKP